MSGKSDMIGDGVEKHLTTCTMCEQPITADDPYHTIMDMVYHADKPYVCSDSYTASSCYDAVMMENEVEHEVRLKIDTMGLVCAKCNKPCTSDTPFRKSNNGVYHTTTPYTSDDGFVASSCYRSALIDLEVARLVQIHINKMDDEGKATNGKATSED